MAGAGAKLFASGDVLTAAQVNTYLMDQSVMRFADATARTNAFGGSGEPVLAEGMLSYLDSDNTVYVYDGSTWKAVGVASTIDAKGDLLVGTADNTVGRQAVGANGTFLIADSAQTNGIAWSAAQTSYRNKIINGGMDIWQRGTSFTFDSGSYVTDRYTYAVASAIPSGTVSRQSFTAGSAPVAPYEVPFFQRWNITAHNGCTIIEVEQKIEDVRTFAGQTVTFSFWAKADATCTLGVIMTQNFGGGGSTSVTTATQTCTLTTAWQRFTFNFSLGSMSGKTIGTNLFLRVFMQLPQSGGFQRVGTYDFWGWQVEAGSVATPFEIEDYGTTLAKCQRYYFLLVSGDAKAIGMAAYYSATHLIGTVSFPVTMRTTPSLVATSGTDYYGLDRSGAQDTFNSLTILQSHGNVARLENTSEVSGSGGVAGYMRTNNASSSIAFSAEL